MSVRVAINGFGRIGHNVVRAFYESGRGDVDIVALDQTKVIDGDLARVMSWYDNEWGFSNRMADTAVAIGRVL